MCGYEEEDFALLGSARENKIDCPLVTLTAISPRLYKLGSIALIDVGVKSSIAQATGQLCKNLGGGNAHNLLAQ